MDYKHDTPIIYRKMSFISLVIVASSLSPRDRILLSKERLGTRIEVKWWNKYIINIFVGTERNAFDLLNQIDDSRATPRDLHVTNPVPYYGYK